MFGGNGRAVVLDENLHFEMPAGPLIAHRNRQRAAGSHRLDGIFENAQEDLLHFGFVASNRGDMSRIFFDDLNACHFQFGGDDRQRVFDDLRDAA